MPAQRIGKPCYQHWMQPAPESGPKATFILLSYARPQNMRRIIGAIKAAKSHGHIIVSNNKPAFDIFDYIDPPDADMAVIEQTREHGAVKRFIIAQEVEAEYFVCIDDDVFLTSNQIDALVGKLVETPSRPHGVWGEIVEVKNNRFTLQTAVHNRNCQVSTINCVYAFTKQHVRRFFRSVESLGFADAEDVGPADDVILGFTGDGSPLCHDLGRLDRCPTSNDKAIALWRQSGFREYRAEIWTRIRNLYLQGQAPFDEAPFRTR